MNEINARSKTIILHNVKEIIHDDKKTKYNEEFKTVSRGIMSNTGHFLCYQITFLFMIIN